MAHPPRILLTGRPGCGKTTVILKTLERLGREAAGFYTEEVRAAGGREGGARLGFDVVSLEGRRGPLARVGAPGPRVGRYGVNVGSFEAIGLASLRAGLEREGVLLVVDEFGKMEFLSRAFVELCERVVRVGNPLLGAILLKPHPIGDRIRSAPGVRVWTVTGENRERLPGELAAVLSA